MKEFSREMIYFVFVSQTLDKKTLPHFQKSNVLEFCSVLLDAPLVCCMVQSKGDLFLLFMVTPSHSALHQCPEVHAVYILYFCKAFSAHRIQYFFFSQLVEMNPTLPKILLKSTFSMWQPPPNICLKGHGIFMSIRRKTLNIIPINYS